MAAYANQVLAGIGRFKEGPTVLVSSAISQTSFNMHFKQVA